MIRPSSIPGSALLASSVVLLVIVSISLPTFSAMDFVRVHADSSILKDDKVASQFRFGIWTACSYAASSGDRQCLPTGHGYTAIIPSTAGQLAIIGASWTRGLAIHPVAAGITFIALVCSFFSKNLITLALTFIAAFVTLIAFACDIALLAFVKHKIGDLDGVKADINTAPAFWLTFVSFILLCITCGMVFFGMRRESKGGDSSSYPMSSGNLWRRFRRGIGY